MATRLQQPGRPSPSFAEYIPPARILNRLLVLAAVGTVAAFAWGFFKGKTHQIPSTPNPHTVLHGPLRDDVSLFVVGVLFAAAIGALAVHLYRNMFERI